MTTTTAPAPDATTDTAPNAAPDTGEPTEPTIDWQAEATKWKGLARKHEGNAKKWEAAEEAQKSELQRAVERAEQAERDASEARAAQLRSDIAREKGVPVALLTAGDEDALNAQADALLAFRAPAAPEGTEPPAGQPAPRFGDPAQQGIPASDEQAVKDAFARQLFQV